MATYVARHRPSEDLRDSVARFAWHQPTVFLVGATLVGFALSRFFLSASGRPRREVHEVHGMVAGAVPSTGRTAVSDSNWDD